MKRWSLLFFLLAACSINKSPLGYREQAEQIVDFSITVTGYELGGSKNYFMAGFVPYVEVLDVGIKQPMQIKFYEDFVWRTGISLPSGEHVVNFPLYNYNSIFPAKSIWLETWRTTGFFANGKELIGREENGKWVHHFRITELGEVILW